MKNIRIHINVDLDDIVNELYHNNDKDVIFEIIKALELKVGEADFCERLYLYFKEQNEEEEKFGS